MEITEKYIKVYEMLAETVDYDILQYCYDYQLMTTPAAIFGRTPPENRQLPADIIDVCARRAVYAAYQLSLRAGRCRCDIRKRYQSVFSDGEKGGPRKCPVTPDDDDDVEEVLRLRGTLWDVLPEQRCLKNGKM